MFDPVDESAKRSDPPSETTKPGTSCRGARQEARARSAARPKVFCPTTARNSSSVGTAPLINRHSVSVPPLHPKHHASRSPITATATS